MTVFVEKTASLWVATLRWPSGYPQAAAGQLRLAKPTGWSFHNIGPKPSGLPSSWYPAKSTPLRPGGKECTNKKARIQAGSLGDDPMVLNGKAYVQSFVFQAGGAGCNPRKSCHTILKLSHNLSASLVCRSFLHLWCRYFLYALKYRILFSKIKRGYNKCYFCLFQRAQIKVSQKFISACYFIIRHPCTFGVMLSSAALDRASSARYSKSSSHWALHSYSALTNTCATSCVLDSLAAPSGQLLRK